MKKLIIAELILIVVTLSIALYNKEETRTEENNYELSIELTNQGYVWNIEPVNIEVDAYKAIKSVRQYRPTDRRTMKYDNAIISEASEEYTNYLANTLAKVDNRLVDRMIEDGWTFHLVDYIPAKFEGSETLGRTVYREKTIYINKDYIDLVTVHEIGHVLYSNYGLKQVLDNAGYNKYDSNGLDRIYTHSGGDALYNYMNLKEHIADLFNEYTFYPGEFESQDPQLYQMYQSTLSQL